MILQNFARVRLKTGYRLTRGWFLSLGIRHRGPYALSKDERDASALMSIIVAVHDSPRVTERCLRSLEAYGGDAEIIIIDDASKLESTRQMLNEFCSRNRWQLITNETPAGHSRASERGAALSTRRYLCLLNSDTVVTQHSWKAMAATFDLSPDIAVSGPSTCYTAGPQMVWRAMHCRHYWTNNQIFDFAELYVAKNRDQPLVDLPFLGGFAFFVRRSAWDKLGGFDKNLPDYGNEKDFCRRIQDLGLRIVWSKAAYIHHFGGESYGRTLGMDSVNERCLQADSYIQKKWDKKLQIERP